MFKKGIVLLNLFFTSFALFSFFEIDTQSLTIQMTEESFKTQKEWVAEEIEGDYVKDRILIKYQRPEHQVLSLNNLFSSAFVVSYDEINTKALTQAQPYRIDQDDSVWYKAELREGTDIVQAINNALKIPGVIYAEPDYVRDLQIDGDPVILNFLEAENLEADLLTDDELLNQQYYLDKVNISEARGFLEENNINPGGSREIIVAVIDTGVDYNHPELAPNMWINPNEIDNGSDSSGNGIVDDIHGASFLGNEWSHNGDPMDSHGHGTHVAGIIAAKGNNQLGIRGVADNVRIMALKAAGSSGIFNTSDIVEAINYAVENGADVINMSFGGYSKSRLELEALELAYNKAVLVAAAGNDSFVNLPSAVGVDMYPAAYPFVIGVMASNEYDSATTFTNFDFKYQDSHEYEIVAPGSSIISTLPNERYAKWDGTSMAAPIISGIAALLKSYYDDPSSHSSRFITGQIVGTADNFIDIPSCMRMYTLHTNYWQANAYNALVSTPEPEMKYYDHYIFDDVSLNPNNNGNGVIDAGETIDLAVLIRNHWGKASDVTVSIDTLTAGGVTDPFVNIIQDTIHYGDVGTYSTKDNGMIYDENSKITHIENPFILEIDPNTPNDYHIMVNVHISGVNGLDPTDTTTYTNDIMPNQVIHLTVRSGEELPTVIEEDMVLTNDKFWIIPNATIIPEGVTVRVEPGTQIQFWSNEEDTVYADWALAYLKVEGKLIVEGTEDNPVKMFPSDLKAAYPVMIFSGNFNGWSSIYNGFDSNDNIRISYAEITNPNIGANVIDHVKFNQNYNYLRSRYIEQGEIVESVRYSTRVRANYIGHSIFSKLGSTETYLFYADDKFKVSGILESNLFDSVYMDPSAQMASNNVFLNNFILEEYQWDDLRYFTSVSRKIGQAINPSEMFRNFMIRRDNSTGTTYVRFEMYHNYYNPPVDIAHAFAESLGGYMVAINSREEESFLMNNFGGYYFIGLEFDPNVGYVWMNGEPVDYTNWGENHNTGSHKFVQFDWDGKWKIGHTPSYYMIEIPGEILLEDIVLLEDTITLSEISDPYQVPFDLYPNKADKSQVTFSSSDETVATVSSDGYITPVSIGDAIITVSNYNETIVKTINVSITEHVDLVDFVIASDISMLEVGMVQRIGVTFTPTNTTERKLNWTSSDDSILSVDRNGFMTALKPGSVTIQVESSDGLIIRTLDIDVIQYANEIKVDEKFVVISTDESLDLNPTILPVEATHKDVLYESSNELVVTVDANGMLYGVSQGTAVIRASLVDSNAYQDIIVSVTDNVLDDFNVQQVLTTDNSSDTRFYALMDNGDVWTWGQNDLLPIQLDLENIVGMDSRDSYIIMYDMSDNVYYMDYMNESLNFNQKTSFSNIKSVSVGSNFYLVLTEEGTVWGWGSNYSGQLGSTQMGNYINQEVQLDITGNVKDIVATSSTSYFLMEDGTIYATGYTWDGNVSEARAIEGVSNASSIYRYSHSEITYITDSGQLYRTSINNNTYLHTELENVISFSRQDNHELLLLSNGEVYSRGNNTFGELGLGHFSSENQFTKIPTDELMISIYAGRNVSGLINEDNTLFVFGKNQQGQLADLSVNNSAIPLKVYFGIESDDTALSILSSSPTDNETYVGRDQNIIIEFNQAINPSTNYGYIRLKDSDDKYVPINKYIYLNKLIIEPTSELEGEKEYHLEIVYDAVKTIFGHPNNEFTMAYSTEPGELYVKNITVPLEPIILSDNGESHQINYVLDPYLVDETYIQWTSNDESIVTVDAMGVLTPISVGETTVTVQDIPGTIIKTMVVKVMPYKAITYFEVTDASLQMSVGDVKKIAVDYLPLDTTETNLSYEVSDSSVLAVNEYGELTALAGGQATITVSSPYIDNLSYTINVSVSEQISELIFEDDYFITSLNIDDSFVLPQIYPLTATETDLIFESSNPDIAYVNEQDVLVKLQAGVVVIRAKAALGQAYDDIIVSIGDYDSYDSLEIIDVKTIHSSSTVISLAKDGTVWMHGLGADEKTPVKLDVDPIQQISGDDYRFGLLTTTGEVYFSRSMYANKPLFEKVTSIQNIIKISVSGNHMLMLSSDGKLWGMGYNTQGQLGPIDIGNYIGQPVELIQFNDVADFAATNVRTYVLTSNQELYYMGGYIEEGYLTVPTIVDDVSVQSIDGYNREEVIVINTDNEYVLIDGDIVTKVNMNGYSGAYSKYEGTEIILTDNGDVYYRGYVYYSNNRNSHTQSHISEFTLIEGLSNIDYAIVRTDSSLFIDQNGRLFYMGRNNNNQHVNFTYRSSQLSTSMIPFGYAYDDGLLEITYSNPINNYDVFDINGQIIIEFSKVIQAGDYLPYLRLINENGVFVEMNRQISLNKLIITPTNPLDYDMSYTLDIPEYALKDLYNNPNTPLILQFTTEPEVMYLRDIILNEDEIYLRNSVEIQHQIDYDLSPSVLDHTSITFTSENPDIATVDEFGVITPRGVGYTTISLISLDGTIVKELTVYVSAYLALDSFKFDQSEIDAYVGDVIRVPITFVPNNSTEKELTYSSSDESIATVDESGFITMLTGGSVTITAIDSTGLLTDSVTINVYQSVESVSFDSKFLQVNLNDDVYLLPNVLPETASNKTITYESSDDSVAYVNSDGKLMILSEGIVVVRASSHNKDIYDEVIISISETAYDSLSVIDVTSTRINGDLYSFALMDDGSVWYWNNQTTFPSKLDVENITQISSGYYYSLVLLSEDGTVYYTRSSNLGFNIITSIPNVVQVSTGSDHIVMLTSDGSVWGMGAPSDGRLGNIQSNNWIDTPIQIQNISGIKQILAVNYGTYYLTNDGVLYYNGYRYNGDHAYIPMVINDLEAVEQIFESDKDHSVIAETINGKYYRAHHSNSSSLIESNNIMIKSIFYSNNNDYFIIDQNGQLWVKGRNDTYGLGLGHNVYVDDWNQHPTLTDIVDVYSFRDVTYVIDDQGKLYGFGSNMSGQISNLYSAYVTSPERIYFGMINDTNPIEIKDIYPDNNEMFFGVNDTISITFNKAIYASEMYHMIQLKDTSGTLIPIDIELRLNQIIIKPMITLDYDKRYTFSMPEAALSDSFGNASQAVQYFFNTRPEIISVQDIIINEPNIIINSETLTYQIDYTLTPSLADDTYITIESSNTDVVSVDTHGLLTIHSIGEATITFKTLDESIIKTINVSVIEKVDLVDFEIVPFQETIYAGYVYKINLTYTPENTTERNFTYSSSDESVATVNDKGYITGLSSGTTTITISDGTLSKTIDIWVETKLDSIEFEDRFFITDINAGPIDLPLLINPIDASNADINWISSNEDVAYFNDSDQLVVLATGNIVVRAEFVGDKSIKAEIIVSIHDVVVDDVYPVKIASNAHTKDNESSMYALMSDGSLMSWGADKPVPINISEEEVIIDIMLSRHNMILLTNDGSIYYGSSRRIKSVSSLNKITSLSNITSVALGYNHYLALDSDGNVWGWGYSDNGSLGVVENRHIGSPRILYALGDAIAISANNYRTVILNDLGQVYILGSGYSTPYQVPNLPFISALGDYTPHESVLYASDGDIYELDYDSALTVRNISLQMRNQGYDIIDYSGRYGGENRLYITIDGRVISYGNNDYFKLGQGNEPIQNYRYYYVGDFTNVQAVHASGANGMLLTENNEIYVWGHNGDNQLSNGENQHSGYPSKINLNVFETSELTQINQYPLNAETGVSINDSFEIKFNQPIVKGYNFIEISLTDELGYLIPTVSSIDMTSLIITPLVDLNYMTNYTLNIPSNSVTSMFDFENTSQSIYFTTAGMPSEVTDINSPQVWTVEILEEAKTIFLDSGYRSGVYNNAILNNIVIPETDMWMRFISESGEQIRFLNYNYWGTVDEFLIGKQIRDYEDYPDLQRIEYRPFLTKDELDTIYPFVVDAYPVDENLDKTQFIGIGTQVFMVEFNRDMDTSQPLSVYFGPDFPYTDYQVDGNWIDARTWQGQFNVTPLTGDGKQYLRIRDGHAADDKWLEIGDDEARFVFEIRTASAESMNLHANSAEGRIILTWLQDDFELLAGYNIYRSQSLDGTYTKINDTVIPNEDKEYSDYNVQPGEIYYYKFTVVKTDLSESDYSNTVGSAAYDTIAPTMDHKIISETNMGVDISFVVKAFDNIGIEVANVYYRPSGTEDFMVQDLIKGTNNQYMVNLHVDETYKDGIEYYIEIGDSLTNIYSGSEAYPHLITVHDYPTLSSVTPAFGDASGNTLITISGSNFKEGATVYFGDYEGLEVEFVDANTLLVKTPQSIPTKVNVKVVNPSGDDDVLINAYEYKGIDASIEVASTRGRLNQEILVPVRVNNVSGLLSADFKVVYDANVLSYIGHLQGNIATRFTTVVNDQTSGELTISMASDIHVSGGGEIIFLRFEVISDADTTYTLENVSLNGGAIETDILGGQFTIDYVYNVTGNIYYYSNQQAVSQVKFTLKGDQEVITLTDEFGQYVVYEIDPGEYTIDFEKNDETDAISAFDAAMILRYSANLDGLDENQLLAADVNNDQAVNSFDAAQILQFVSGLKSLPFNGRTDVWEFYHGSETISITNSDYNLGDIKAILIGDVSGNYQSNQTQLSSTGYIGISSVTLDDSRITMPVNIRVFEENIYAIETTIQFNSSLKFIEVQFSEEIKDYMTIVNPNNPGEIKIVIAGVQAIDNIDGLFKVVFEKTSDTEDEYNFNINNTLFNENSNIIEVNHIYKLSLIYDVNNDGLVDNADIEVLIESINTSFRHNDISAYDYNHDGVIDLYDIIMMRNQ